MTSHIKSRDQLGHPSPNTIAPQTIMPNIGTTGTHGVLKWRGASGSVLRIIITPAHTSINANKVPMLVISPAISPGTNAAKNPTKTKRIRLDLYGVRNLG